MTRRGRLPRRPTESERGSLARLPTLAGVVLVRALGPEDAFCRLLGGISPLRPDVVLDARKALSRVTLALTDGARRPLAPGRAVLACAREPRTEATTPLLCARLAISSAMSRPAAYP